MLEFASCLIPYSERRVAVCVFSCILRNHVPSLAFLVCSNSPVCDRQPALGSFPSLSTMLC